MSCLPSHNFTPLYPLLLCPHTQMLRSWKWTFPFQNMKVSGEKHNYISVIRSTEASNGQWAWCSQSLKSFLYRSVCISVMVFPWKVLWNNLFPTLQQSSGFCLGSFSLGFLNYQIINETISYNNMWNEHASPTCRTTLFVEFLSSVFGNWMWLYLHPLLDAEITFWIFLWGLMNDLHGQSHSPMLILTLSHSSSNFHSLRYP